MATPQELEAKFCAIAGPVADAARQARLIAAFRGLERVADVNAVTADWLLSRNERSQ